MNFFTKCFLVLAFIIITIIQVEGHDIFTHECHHDLLDIQVVPNHNKKELNSNRFRKLASTDPLPMRIHADFKNINLADEAKEIFLKEKLMPAVISYIKYTLSVVPESGKLTFLEATCSTASIDTIYRDQGVTAEMVLFVKTDLADANAIASGVPCIVDPSTGRPLAGMINFNPLLLSTTTDAWKTIYLSAVHEMFHVLAFTRSLFSLFKSDDGTTRTDVVQSTNIRTLNTQIVTMDEVLEKARLYFSCLTMAGVELENQDGTPTTSTHWERRIMGNDIMTMTVQPNSVVSDMTLGFLEGTGWYTVNYSNAEPLAWGKNRGCGFINNYCINSVNGVPISSEFCTSLNSHGCTADYTHKALCGVKVGSPLYSVWNYFNDEIVSLDTYSDNCPYYIPYSKGDCRNEAHNTNEVLFEEVYGDKSKCFVGTLTKNDFSLYYNPNNVRGACFEYECKPISLGYELDIIIGETRVSCPNNGGQMGVSGYSGYVQCPDPDEFCARTMCSLTCSGNGVCLDGKCVCNEGFSGSDCSTQICLEGCNGKGTCSPQKTCLCDDGWGGADCSEKYLVPSCTRCKSILDCYGDKCECFPYPGRDCENLIESYNGASILTLNLSLLIVSIFIFIFY